MDELQKLLKELEELTKEAEPQAQKTQAQTQASQSVSTQQTAPDNSELKSNLERGRRLV
jgi:hypothetical protein